MATEEDNRNEENLGMEEENDELRNLPLPPLQRDEGSSQNVDPLDTLGQLFERILANRIPPPPVLNVPVRDRVSKAQRNFHQQKPPTFSGEADATTADKWLSAIEEAFRATAIYDDDLRLMTAPSLFREDAVQWWETEMQTHELDKGT